MKKTMQFSIRFPLGQIAAILCLAGVYLGMLIGSYDSTIPEALAKWIDFGFQQFKSMPLWVPLSGGFACGLCILACYLRGSQIDRGIDRIEEWLGKRWWVWLLIAAISAAIFFLLRNEFLNPDGVWFAEKFARDVPAKGAHVTHDEMWELYLHSRFWLYTNHWWGWSVALSYQVVSSLAGGAFVFLLWVFSRELLQKKWLPFFLLMVSGAYMQLYFGDVENYTLVGVLILAYLLAAVWFIRGKAPVVLPAVILAVAMAFHLLAGFLGPSLVVLYWFALRRKHYADMAAGVLLFGGIIGGTLWYMNNHGLPIQELFTRSFALGYGGEVETWVEPSWETFAGQINLLFLLLPVWWMAIGGLTFGLRDLDEINGFFLTAVAVMMFLFFAWKSAIGIYNDWNLFANSAFVLAAFIWYNLLKQPWKWKSEILAGCFFANALPSYTWIVMNHFV